MTSSAHSLQATAVAYCRPRARAKRVGTDSYRPTGALPTGAASADVWRPCCSEMATMSGHMNTKSEYHDPRALGRGSFAVHSSLSTRPAGVKPAEVAVRGSRSPRRSRRSEARARRRSMVGRLRRVAKKRYNSALLPSQSAGRRRARARRAELRSAAAGREAARGALPGAIVAPGSVRELSRNSDDYAAAAEILGNAVWLGA